jgi:hypothetical protein
MSLEGHKMKEQIIKYAWEKLECVAVAPRCYWWNSWYACQYEICIPGQNYSNITTVRIGLKAVTKREFISILLVIRVTIRFRVSV